LKIQCELPQFFPLGAAHAGVWPFCIAEWAGVVDFVAPDAKVCGGRGVVTVNTPSPPKQASSIVDLTVAGSSH
jgi:hypothetical protein